MATPEQKLRALAQRISQLQAESDSGNFTNASELSDLTNHVKELQQRHIRPQSKMNQIENVSVLTYFS